MKGSKCLRVLGNKSCEGSAKHVVLERMRRMPTFSPTDCDWSRRWSQWYIRHSGCGSEPGCNANTTETEKTLVIPSWHEKRSYFPVFLRILPTSFSEENYFKSTVAYIHLQQTAKWRGLINRLNLLVTSAVLYWFTIIISDTAKLLFHWEGK